MKNLISKSFFRLPFLATTLFVLFLQGCKLLQKTDRMAAPIEESLISKRFAHYYQGTLNLPGQTAKITTYVAASPKQREIGLSFVKPDQMMNEEGLLFISQIDSTQHFWMPNTHFDLDIFYLSTDLIVLDVQRNVPHFPQKGPNHLVPRAKPVFARHVLEMKSGSPLSQKIKYGNQLIWNGEYSLEQILSNIHQAQ